METGICLIRLTEEAGDRTFDPRFTRRATYPLHHGDFFALVLQEIMVAYIESKVLSHESSIAAKEGLVKTKQNKSSPLSH